MKYYIQFFEPSLMTWENYEFSTSYIHASIRLSELEEINPQMKFRIKESENILI